MSGRDGKPALAIPLTEDGDWDRQLLVYMAEGQSRTLG